MKRSTSVFLRTLVLFIVLLNGYLVAARTSSETSIDSEGNYELTLPAGISVIDFSFFGYLPRTVFFPFKSVIKEVLIEDVKVFNKVVMIGYGEQSSLKLTTSVSSFGLIVLTNVGVADSGQSNYGKV